MSASCSEDDDAPHSLLLVAFPEFPSMHRTSSAHGHAGVTSDCENDFSETAWSCWTLSSKN
jgi:hypothetical protein